MNHVERVMRKPALCPWNNEDTEQPAQLHCPNSVFAVWCYIFLSLYVSGVDYHVATTFFVCRNFNTYIYIYGNNG